MFAALALLAHARPASFAGRRGGEVEPASPSSPGRDRWRRGCRSRAEERRANREHDGAARHSRTLAGRYQQAAALRPLVRSPPSVAPTAMLSPAELPSWSQRRDLLRELPSLRFRGLTLAPEHRRRGQRRPCANLRVHGRRHERASSAAPSRARSQIDPRRHVRALEKRRSARAPAGPPHAAGEEQVRVRRWRRGGRGRRYSNNRRFP